MKSIAILSVCVAFALAQGPGGHHGGSRLMPVSCQNQDRDDNRECVQNQLERQGYGFDHDALRQCFESCQGQGKGQGGQVRGGQGQGQGQGQGRGGGRGRFGKGQGQGGQGQGQGQSQRQDLRALFECVEEQVRPQMESCVKSRINFAVTEAERPEGGEGGFGGRARGGRGGRGQGRNRQTRQAGFGGGKGRGGHGKGRGGDMLDNLLERAQQCGVVECVQNVVPQQILNNPDAFKTAHCQARKQCRSQNQNSQCHTERQQLMRAQCECGQQVDRESVMAQCEASTGLSFPGFPQGKGGQQFDCSQIGQNRPDFDDEEC